MSLTYLIILFALYSFIGWVLETVYCSIPAQKFVYRGFLVGPVCPVYGIGAIAVALILTPFHHHPELVFFFGVILTSVLEYASSVLLEKLFNKSWWDYSNRKFNVNGRICLMNSSLFGALSLFLIYVLHPMFTALLARMPENIVPGFAVSLSVVFCIDLFVSVRNTLDFNREMGKLSDLTDRIEKKREEIKVSMDAFRFEQHEKLELELTGLIELQEESLELFLRKMRRILNAFPHMRLHRKDKLSLHDRLLSYRWKK